MTLAEIAEVPPTAGTVPGLALTPILAAAAAPTAILMALVPLADTPPEMRRDRGGARVGAGDVSGHPSADVGFGL